MNDATAMTTLEGPIRFRKALRVQDLILFGIVCVTPTAPIPWFGILQKLSHGQAATTIAFAMLAMLPTAYSYGRMAVRYPAAGSAYIYVSRSLHPQLGFIAGWATTLDYFLIPIASVLYCALTMYRVVSVIPFIGWVAFFTALATFLNLRGIRTGVRTQQVLLALMVAVLFTTIAVAVHYLSMEEGMGGLMSVGPFYEPQVFDFKSIATATSLAAITYIGFDAVTTLAEEVENPTRSLARATVWVCLITGLFSILIVYLGQLVWPAYQDFKDFDTAFLDVAQRIGGNALFTAMAVVLLLASFGSALTGQAGAARVLFGMGRSGELPQRFFGYLNASTLQPSYNVCFTGLVAFVGAALLDFERAGGLLNFGAFFAFMGVNLAALNAALQAWRSGSSREVFAPLVSLLGFLSCLAIWLSLPPSAKRVGFAWLAIGVLYHLIRTRSAKRASP